MKRRLTSKFINEIQPPAKGELWIADTEVKGLGLRLWATKSGGSKAYCLRLGSRKRLTFDPHRGNGLRFSFIINKAHKSEVGAYLNAARNWAYHEIKANKTNPLERVKLRLEEQQQRDYFKKRISQLTLNQAAQNMIKGMEAAGRSEAYRDQLDSLFHTWQAEELKNKPLEAITAKELAEALVDRKYTWANIRALRAFIHKIYEQGSSFGVRNPIDSYEYSDEISKAFDEKYDVRYPELKNLNPAIHQRIFQILEKNTAQWQQAYCIRLYFEFGAPMTRLMAARWDQILDGQWYPYLPHEKKLWFQVREQITDEVKLLLNRISSFRKRDFAASEYWFPSPNAKSKAHITTVSRLWAKTLKQAGIDRYPLHEFVQTYREHNCPSYYSTYFREYIDRLQTDQKMAVMSKLQQG